MLDLMLEFNVVVRLAPTSHFRRTITIGKYKRKRQEYLCDLLGIIQLDRVDLCFADSRHRPPITSLIMANVRTRT
jgi:hypothetical protein